MSKTNYNIKSVQKRGSIVAPFFIAVAVFILTGFLPKYLEYLDANGIELSENLEDESQEEEKEKETETEKKSDKYNETPIATIAHNPKRLNKPDGHFHKWQNPFGEIITPPPEFI